ncbi:unnamed protein product [Gordionus sp. m RMFG-2023]
MSKHSHLYKKKIGDVEDLRRRRSEISIELRKSKKEEIFQKRRNIESFKDDNDIDIDDEEASSTQTQTEKIRKYVEMAYDNDSINSFKGIQKIRKLLASSHKPPIDKLINLNILPKLIECLQKYDQPETQFEACWALTNIASGTSEQTKALINSGALHWLVNLLSSPHIKVCEQATWALGNIIGDGPGPRDSVLSSGLLPPFLTLLDRALIALADQGTSCPTTEPSKGDDYKENDKNKNKELSLVRNLAWVITNLCRNKNSPVGTDAIALLLIAIVKILQVCNDSQILIDSLWAICYVTDIGNDHIQFVIDIGLINIIVPFLSHVNYKVKTSALRALGNIVTGTDTQTQLVIDSGILPYFHDMLQQTDDEKLIKESLWFLSNIAAGNKDQIQTLYQSGLMPAIIQCSKRVILLVLQTEAIPSLCDRLTIKDPQLLKIILQSLSCVLKYAARSSQSLESRDNVTLNILVQQIEQCGGLDKIESLQRHENAEIYAVSNSIVDIYFSHQSNEEDTSLSTKDFSFQTDATPVSDTTFNF